ncbi:sulfatase [Falsiroseomonas bella]|uniref:Sulfatase n=1 Tax=Falsiroseomonas bella TaxID=2184016 RepID=A0A317F8P4_9PROT|nr:sulfatase-like hydrolase/transferase [Falsiroseomonas bella]PWS34852.1 sulfatase [Falsiroseomonas bella]
MDGTTHPVTAPSRRGLLAAAVAGLGAPRAAGAQPVAAPGLALRGGVNRPPNLLFVFTDQERYAARWPAGLSLPAHERLARAGVTFNAHHCPAVMCTSSRAVLLTGLQTPDNGMFENTDVPWISKLSPDIPTIGHMLRQAGYYTAYKGKWHLNDSFDSAEPERLFTREMEEHGFADYNGVGDIIGHALGGYQFDHLIAGSAVTWLRRHGRVLEGESKPWALFVSLVNPHDVMFFNTDAPGQAVQDSGTLIQRPQRAPDHALYRATWDTPTPPTLTEPFDAPGRPAAHREFHRMWNIVLGHIPPEPERWRRFHDYYINCLRNVDNSLSALLAELDLLRLTDRTAVVFTADHGEMAGAHGLHGKGPFAYRETTHLPLYVTHPDVRGGQDCRALSGHIDMVPTLLGMAGVAPGRVAELAGRALPGKDLTPLLANPGAAGPNTLREGVLFTYSGLSTNDASLWQAVATARAAGKDPKAELRRQGFQSDLTKRGSLRSVFDGRYRFTRYFAPTQRNRPATLDELYRWNDVELFDLESDPAETRNLAADRVANAALVEAMRARLERAITAEIGSDDGREMPDFPRVEWSLDRADL